MNYNRILVENLSLGDKLLCVRDDIIESSTSGDSAWTGKVVTVTRIHNVRWGAGAGDSDVVRDVRLTSDILYDDVVVDEFQMNGEKRFYRVPNQAYGDKMVFINYEDISDIDKFDIALSGSDSDVIGQAYESWLEGNPYAKDRTSD